MPSFFSRLVAGLAATTLVSAAPALFEHRVESRASAISQELFDTFVLMEQYAAASYCVDNNNSTNTKLVCESSSCSLVKAANTTSVSEFQNSLVTDVTGFVATDATNSLVVISFRGSESVRNYLSDINFDLADASDLCDGCEAFEGFYTAWCEARDGVLAAARAAADANPSYRIVAVGHSLGGAVAAFAATELRNAGYAVELYSFGQPRIGPAAISDYITDQGAGANFRITHKKDPIPKLPPLVTGFVHLSPEYYIDTGAKDAVEVGDVKGPYEGKVNLLGNTKDLLIDIDAHKWYFNRVSACKPGNFEFRKRATFSMTMKK